MAANYVVVVDAPPHHCEHPKMPHIDDGHHGQVVAKWRCDVCGQRWKYVYDVEHRYTWDWMKGRGKPRESWLVAAIYRLQHEVDS